MSAVSLVSSSTIGAIAGGLFFLGVIPILLLIVLGIRRKISGAALAVGFASFFFSQIVLRIPLLSALSAVPAFASFASGHPYLYALVVGGLSAGLFEETARVVGALCLKKHRSYRDVVSFGLGHGICEVLSVAGLSYISLLSVALALNTDPAVLSSALGEEQMALILQQVQSITPVIVFWAVIERVSAVLLHMFNTALVFRAVTQKKTLFYVLAVALHTVFNFAAVLLLPLGVAVCELVLLAGGLACGWGLLRARSWFEPKEVPAAAE